MSATATSTQKSLELSSKQTIKGVIKMIEIIGASHPIEQSKTTETVKSKQISCSPSSWWWSSSPSLLSPARSSLVATWPTVSKQHDELHAPAGSTCCPGAGCASSPSSANRSNNGDIDQECFKFIAGPASGDHEGCTRLTCNPPLWPSSLCSTGSEPAAQINKSRLGGKTIVSASSPTTRPSCRSLSRQLPLRRSDSPPERCSSRTMSPRYQTAPIGLTGRGFARAVALLAIVALIDQAPASLAQSTGQQDDGRPGQGGGGDGGQAASLRDLREAKPISAEQLPVNMSEIFQTLFKKKPYSKYWTVEQKWDDLFQRGMAVQDTMRRAMLKNFLRDIEDFADISVSAACERDLKYVQSYARQSTNFRWLAHMVDSAGKSEPGMLTGMLAHMGHPVQCIRVRAPGRPSNDTFDERFFEQQTQALGERFRGKYCLASLRPVLPLRPNNVAISRFSELMNSSLISNISYTGEPAHRIKARVRQLLVPQHDIDSVDRQHLRLDQVPFESELYEYLIAQRNFMFSLPRYIGACYPSSCNKEDVRSSLQRTMNDQHQVVDVEFECEQEEFSIWDWFNTPRLIAYVVLGLVCGFVFLASFTRYILLSKMQIKRSRLAPNSGMANLLNALDMFSVDKCAGILFVKTKPASPEVDWTKVENNRSTSIDALRGLMLLVLVYSQLTVLGCLPVPFMWSKWSDAMFPFYRSLFTQFFINMSIWSELFYTLSAYIIGLKVLENYRPKPALLLAPSSSSSPPPPLSNNSRPHSSTSEIIGSNGSASIKLRTPNFFAFAAKRYIRLVLPMAAFMLFNYVWPRLSNGFVMQDQANKIMKPCDSFGWTNFLLLHNHNLLNETCLWPSHVSATFFQLHLLSYPILVLCLVALCNQFKVHYADYDGNKERKRMIARLLICLVYGTLATLGLLGALYSALQASQHSLIVPFLIDYIDFDNYRRVLEWTVTPTYNHLASYMIGLGVAFVVIRARAGNELRRMQRTQWGFDGNYQQRDEGSIASARSSSTQELNQQLDSFRLGMNLDATHQIHQKQFNISTDSSGSSEKRFGDLEDNCSSSSDSLQSGGSRASFAQTTLSLMLCLAATHASWLWNGLGQPMSDQQTFWFVLLTKLVFALSSAHLFYKYLATRRNSTNPWMITRFLVPIGRMSLTVFYVSWLVIWFDLLSSLYQWHPSHYFISEKYNEIIFMTLILAMLVYGAFEGIVKRIQYASRDARLRQDARASKANQDVNSSSGSSNNERRLQWARSHMRPFESFFDASDKPSLLELYDLMKLSESESASSAKLDQERSLANGGNNGAKDRSGSNLMNSTSISNQQQQQQRVSVFVQQHQDRPQTYLSSTGDLSTISGNVGSQSPSDRYKLNAELRANYSFASIGLYESAGATGDLSHGSTKRSE